MKGPQGLNLQPFNIASSCKKLLMVVEVVGLKM